MAEATEIVAHGLPLGVERRWTCASCGQQFATLGPLLYLLFFAGAVGFGGVALFAHISGGESGVVIARTLLFFFAVSLAVVAGTRLRADLRSPRL